MKSNLKQDIMNHARATAEEAFRRLCRGEAFRFYLYFQPESMTPTCNPFRLAPHGETPDGAELATCGPVATGAMTVDQMAYQIRETARRLPLMRPDTY